MRNKVNALGIYALFNDNTLEKYFTLSKTVGGYSVDKFIGFDKHETILIPETFCGEPIVTLQENLFYNCQSIKNIIIEAPITILPNHSFSMSSLETVILPDTIEFFDGTGMFVSTLITEIVLPLNLKVLPRCTFMYCENLKTVLLNEMLKKIDGNAFRNTPLSEITLPDRLEEIDVYGLDETLLKEITIPRSTHISCSLCTIPTSIVLKCYSGSYAHKWAIKHGFTIKNAEEDA